MNFKDYNNKSLQSILENKFLEILKKMTERNLNHTSESIKIYDEKYEKIGFDFLKKITNNDIKYYEKLTNDFIKRNKPETLKNVEFVDYSEFLIE